MHVLIVDDELLARNRLHVLLSECEDPASPFQVEEADSLAQAQVLVQSSAIPFDIVFIGLHMPSHEGMVFAQTMRAMKHAPAVVFVTPHVMYTASDFDVDAVDYLTKPVRLESLQQTIAKIRRIQLLKSSTSAGDTAAALLIRDRGRAERVPLHHIVYLKAEQKYVTVRTASRTYILDSSLSEIEERFPNFFLRIHRNALINTRQMRSLEKHYTDDEVECWALRMYSVPELLQVSRRQLASVRTVLQNNPRHTEQQQTQAV